MGSLAVFRPISVSSCWQAAERRLWWERRPFQDRRLVRCWQKLQRRMEEVQSVVLQQLGKTTAEVAAFSRFLANKRVTVQELIYQSCQVPAAAGLDVLVLGDTSSYTLERQVRRIRDAERLGMVEGNRSKGYFVQAMLATDRAQETVLGLADLLFWQRAAWTPTYDADGRKERKDTYQMAEQDKETYRWGLGMTQVQQSLANARSITFVFDRGADAYTVYQAARQASSLPPLELVVRASPDRLVGYAGQRLLLRTVLEQAAPLGRVPLPLRTLDHVSTTNARRIQRAARTALLELRAVAIDVLPPTTVRSPTAGPLPFIAIEAREVTPALPAGVEPVYWCLLTTLSATTLAEAEGILTYYTRRWMVEQLFRTTKSEGLRLESTELEHVDAILKQAILGFQTACKVLQLVYARQRFDSPPVHHAFSEHECQVLERLQAAYQGKTPAQQNPYPRDQLSWAAWVIARLGGWKGYTSKGKRPPGPITMLRGLEKFAVFLEAWSLLQTLPPDPP